MTKPYTELLDFWISVTFTSDKKQNKISNTVASHLLLKACELPLLGWVGLKFWKYSRKPKTKIQDKSNSYDQIKEIDLTINTDWKENFLINLHNTHTVLLPTPPFRKEKTPKYKVRSTTEGNVDRYRIYYCQVPSGANLGL